MPSRPASRPSWMRGSARDRAATGRRHHRPGAPRPPRRPGPRPRAPGPEPRHLRRRRHRRPGGARRGPRARSCGLGRPHPRAHLREGRLPLSTARNLGAATAISAGAEHLVFLDVDCIPNPTLVARYGEVLTDAPDGGGPRVVCGDVAYEPPPPAGREPGGRQSAPPPSGSPAPATGRDPGGGRRVPVLVAVLRGHRAGLHPRRRLRRGLRRLRRARTPTSASGSPAAGDSCCSWVAREPSTSTTRAPAHRCSTSRDIVRTPTSSPTSGGGGRCRRGSSSSASAGWPAAARRPLGDR